MAKEIFLYTDFYRWTAEEFAMQINEAGEDAITVRMWTNGGSVQAGYAMLNKMSEHGNVSLKVDGDAFSMGAFMSCHFANVSCLDTSEFGFHRAAYWNETDMTDADRVSLERINSYLRKGFESKIDVQKFNAITGISVDEMFDMTKRIDVTLTAQQAQEVGLVDEITAVSDTLIKSIAQNAHRQAAFWASKKDKTAQVEIPVATKVNSKTSKMTVEKLRSEHPELFNEVVALGVSQERDRAGAWLAFADVDTKGVVEGIKKGETLSQTAMAEFSRKSLSAQALVNLEEDSPKTVTADKTETDDAKAQKDKEIEAFLEKSRQSYVKNTQE